MDADESEETNQLILNEIEKLVAAKNERNREKMAQKAAILPRDLFARGAYITLLLPKAVRLLGKLLRIYRKVI